MDAEGVKALLLMNSATFEAKGGVHQKRDLGAVGHGWTGTDGPNGRTGPILTI